MTAAKNKKMDRQIKGIFVPIEIWQDRTLTWNEKVLLMEVDSFTSKDMDCFFSNEYIANLLGVKEDTASKLVSSLIRKGFIRQTRFDGRKRYLQTCIEIQSRVGYKSEADYDGNHTQTMSKIIDNKIDNKPGNKTLSNDKDNISIRPKAFDFRKALLSAGVEPKVADAWLQVRKAKKGVNTEIAWNDIEKELRLAMEKFNLSTPTECIRMAVVKSWCGFKAKWMENELNPSRPVRTSTPSPSPSKKSGDPLDYNFSQYYE